ncbi:MAG: hypothetical protein U5P41_07265 [Gammaproteobacteria bacterium]|nr:hypothetical protein [Gammaproteobacteria bacterium]
MSWPRRWRASPCRSSKPVRHHRGRNARPRSAACSGWPKTLPVWPRLADIRGLGSLGLALIVGAAGNLSDYPDHSKLWKRLGLAVIDGGRQRRVAGNNDLAVRHGYSPQRRADIWRIGDSLFRAQSERVDKETGELLRAAGPWREVYDARRRPEATDKCATDGVIPASSTRATVDKWHAAGLALEHVTARRWKENPAAYRSAKHIHERARRYMEKKLVKFIWQQWRLARNSDSPDPARALVPAPLPAPLRPGRRAGGHGNRLHRSRHSRRRPPRSGVEIVRIRRGAGAAGAGPRRGRTAGDRTCCTDRPD